MRTILKTLSVLALLLGAAYAASAQSLKIFDWNVLSYERQDKSGETSGFPIADHLAKIQAVNPDIITFNEYESASDRMSHKEKAAEVAAALGMYSYYIMSYPKSGGYYGNAILSKYPIVNAASMQFQYRNHTGEGNYILNADPELTQWGTDQRSVGYVDILVPVSVTESTIVRVVCSHFDHKGSNQVRTNQATWSVQFASLDNPPCPTIMAGDLNTSSDSVLQPLIDAGDHMYVYWVDHIFTFPKGRWTRVGNGSNGAGGNLSDHNYIYAMFDLNAAE